MRVLNTLTEHGKKEAHVLQERVALCQAASDIYQPGLAVPTLKQNLVLLKSYHCKIPFEMRCSLVGQLLIGKFKESAEIAPTDTKKAVAIMEECCKAIVLDLPVLEDAGEEVKVASIDVKQPSLLQLVKEMEEYAALQSDATFFKSTGATAGSDDEEAANFFDFNQGKSSKSEETPSKQKNEETDQTRSWEARSATLWDK